VVEEEVLLMEEVEEPVVTDHLFQVEL